MASVADPLQLWGTSIEPFDERMHPARFMVITGLGQVFSFQVRGHFYAFRLGIAAEADLLM